MIQRHENPQNRRFWSLYEFYKCLCICFDRTMIPYICFAWLWLWLWLWPCCDSHNVSGKKICWDVAIWFIRSGQICKLSIWPDLN